MAIPHVIASSEDRSHDPVIRKIGFEDLISALSDGVEDFKAMPSHVLFLGIIYPIVGLILSRLIFGYSVVPLLFPLAAGFALLGPVAAIGLYELSRRREQGLDTSWKHAFSVIHSPSIGAILMLAALLVVIFLVWLAVAQSLYQTLFDYGRPESFGAFFDQVFGTGAGWKLIVYGNLIGFLFAAVVLTISAVSFPLLLDRDVGAGVAMLTSIRAVLANPVPMFAWGLIVAALLAIGSLPFLVGLALVVPILGHATWHLYRRVVA